MSAPALAPRPVSRPAPGRPASGRSVAGGPPAARSATARSATARSATARPAPRTSPDPRPRMRVVTRPDLGPRRVGFALTCTAVLGALMLGLLLLNVAISGNAFTIAELQSRQGVLVDQQQSLEQQLLVRSSPSALADQARGLGMVPAPQTIVIAPDGTGAPPVEEPVEEP